MNLDGILALAWRDLQTVIRNRGIRIPLIVAPVIILIVLPVFLIAGQEILEAMSGATGPGANVLERTPFTGSAEDAQRVAESVGAAAAWPAFVLEIFIAPLYLLVPLVTSTVIAADSFAGERERGTLEPILHSPTTDSELLIAKVVAAWIPAVTVALGGFAVYSVVANVLAWPSMGRIFFPTPTWLLLAFWVAPSLAAFGLGVMVIVSSRVRTLQAAHQIGSLLVLPILLLLIGQVSGVTEFDFGLLALMGLLLWAASAALLLWAAGSFERERLAVRL